ncbi:MAG: cysteine desulfurase family protein [Bacilli bacterium]
MIYLDYSATTPVNKEVLDSFNKTCLEYIGNSNSLHNLGVKSKNLEESATNQIANILNCQKEEVIYTSGSSESNNLAIKGIALKYQNRGKHIITTNLEHSSIYGPLGYLQQIGFRVDFVKTNEFGLVDIENLKELITKETILVTIASVNSESGIKQNIEQIANLLINYPATFFHVDATQSIGKVNIDFTNVDLISFSAHKFYGLKGIGCLIKKKNISLIPLIHGGKSTTNFRSGTPALPLIVSLSKALRLETQNLDHEFEKIFDLNNYLKDKLKQYQDLVINSNQFSIPHILNISLINIKPETMIHALEKYEIYISTQSACAAGNTISKAIYEITKNELIAAHSIRISLSKLTTKLEIDTFLKYFDICYRKLNIK